MKRINLLKLLSDVILNQTKSSPLLVGIDGIDASGKTTLANELAEKLKPSGRPIVRASIDDFHNPKEVRYARGDDSPEGYYFDSFDHNALAEELLKPLSSGELQYKTAVFDYRTDSVIVLPVQTAANDAILIMEGVFLFRPEWMDYWDIKIFIEVEFKNTLPRALKRAAEREYFGAEQTILDKYEKRYIPGQKLYFAEAQPKEKADIVIDNNDFENPVIMQNRFT